MRVVDAEQFVKTAAFMQAVVAQVQCADGILINKTDLITASELDQLGQVLRGMNAHASPQYPCRESANQTRRRQIMFFATLRDIGPKILRLKGNLRFDRGSHFVEVVGERIIEKDPCPRLSTDTQFTVIGWRIEKEALTNVFQDCWPLGSASWDRRVALGIFKVF